MTFAIRRCAPSRPRWCTATLPILALGAVLVSLTPGPASAQAVGPQQTQGTAGQTEVVHSDVRAVLSQYGAFTQHGDYGEVWVPTSLPQGWHPYPPCHWVNTKQYGWYFDDRTAWGQIVHHYGRWVLDGRMGWIWVPGNEFSPGWVAWRTSEQWIGWAPLPPDQKFQAVSANQSNDSDEWLFMEVEKFGKSCTGTVTAAPDRVPTLLHQTKYITQLEYVDGIAVFVLPPYIVGPFVVIDVGFDPWSAWFLAQMIINWNWLWNNTLIWNVSFVCAPQSP